jgi:hypothetical protein
VQRFIVIVEGLPLEEYEEIELPRAPTQGEPIETRYGTCIVMRTEPPEEGSPYRGRIVCQAP